MGTGRVCHLETQGWSRCYRMSVCVVCLSKAEAAAAFLLISPGNLPFVSQLWVPSVSYSPHPPPAPESSVDLCTASLLPEGVSEHPLSDTWGQKGNVPSSHQGGSDFIERKKVTSVKHSSHENSCSHLGEGQEKDILKLNAI